MKNFLNRSVLINVGKGVLLGIAGTVPGLSGGTIAVICGIYEPLIGFFASLSQYRKQKDVLLRECKNIAPLLLPVILGGLLGLFLTAFFLSFMFETVPVQTQFLFLGLILGSLPMLVHKGLKVQFRVQYLLPFAVCLLAILFLSLYARQLPDSTTLISSQQVIREVNAVNALILIAAGTVSFGAMIIPGLSGNFLMVILGLYATFRTMLVEFNVVFIALFMIGGVFGLLIVSRGISFLLQRFYGVTYFGIIGLVIGSLAYLWPGLEFNLEGLQGFFSMLGGASLAYSLSARPALREKIFSGIVSAIRKKGE